MGLQGSSGMAEGLTRYSMKGEKGLRTWKGMAEVQIRVELNCGGLHLHSCVKLALDNLKRWGLCSPCRGREQMRHLERVDNLPSVAHWEVAVISVLTRYSAL